MDKAYPNYLACKSQAATLKWYIGWFSQVLNRGSTGEMASFAQVTLQSRMAGVIYASLYGKSIASMKIIGALFCFEDMGESLLICANL